MREDHDGGAALQSGEILLKPIQLRLAKFAHALKLNDVHQTNKVHTLVIEAIPAIPLWAIYPTWGWGTSDSEQALAMLRRFGSVSVLNGHIHQIMQKVEGNLTFHTAMSTAFPQPAPGTAPSPGPMKVPADKLRNVLGITHANFVAQKHDLAVIDASLSGAPIETHEARLLP